MNPLYLSGFGVSLNVDRARLIVKDGFLEPDSTQKTYVVPPRNSPYDSVVIDGQTGTVSIMAIKWLMRHGVPIFIMDYNGTLLSSTLPKEPVNGPLKIAQVEAYRDPVRRFSIAKKLVEAKTRRTVDVLDWLADRYGRFNSESELKQELERLRGCENLPRLLSIEGRIADFYWRYLQKVLPDRLGFTSRMHESHQMNASDPVNVLLNYGYAILESQCRKAINSVGLEPTVGFLHEVRQTKQPLVYDLQEPFRWLVDVTVIESLQYRLFSGKDFYRMDNYVLRLKPEAARRLIDALRIRFNSTVDWKGKSYSLDTVMKLKVQELANYILGRRHALTFEQPSPTLPVNDSETYRKFILELSLPEARKLGVGKSTLWYIQHRARNGRPFKVYGKIIKRFSGRAVSG